MSINKFSAKILKVNIENKKTAFVLAVLFLILGFSTVKTNAQSTSFGSPVAHTIRLSGTFGELRPNHFHSGIDIKGAVGSSILAIEDGYVSRIKVSGGGYGKVLYITHLNGYTSVYAHLSKFEKNIDAFVKKYQYENQVFDVEIHLGESQFTFKKGERIGRMGMTGHAFGPHLHFEIRETKTDKTVNPLGLGIKVKDGKKPRLHEIRLYELSDKSETKHTKNYTLRKSKHSKKYKIKGDTIFTSSDFIGLALKAYDHMDGVTNWNGIYSIQSYSDDSLFFEFKLDAFSFDETRYINAHLDYQEQVTKKSFFNRCFKMPGSQLSMYRKVKKDGVLHLKKGVAQKITMVVKDIKGNSAVTEFWVKKSRLPTTALGGAYNYYLPYDEDNMIDNGSMLLRLPKGSLYENLYLDFEANADDSDDVYASTVHVHDYKTPVHKFYDLSLFPYKLPPSLKEKAFIAYCPPNSRKIINCGGEWHEKMLKTKVRDFGDFTVMADTVAPVIKIRRFKSNMKGWTSISFTITDNFKTARNVKGLKYRATIDDQWILMEFDAKKDRIQYTFDKNLKHGRHQFRLTVEDCLGNETVFEKTFTW